MRTGVYIMSLAEAIKIRILILMKEKQFSQYDFAIVR